MKKLVFHIDVNSAFLSWEAARRVQNGENDIRLIPSAIGGDREKRTGVILAKSMPAKKFDIRTGEPIAQALRKCPQLYLARPDFRLYEKCSKAFMDICRKYAPAVEKYSIDECFLDMSGTELIYPDPIALAYKIKDEIKNELGFTVNVGISENKILGKMASEFEKPDKVHTLFKNEIADKMWPLPIRELFSVGCSTAERLEKAKVSTIGELANTPLSYVQTLVGVKQGKQIHDYANGIDDSPVRDEREDPKGYGNSTTLAEDVVTLEDAEKILLALADTTSARMRADGAKAFCVAVTIRGNDFKNKSHQRKLHEPTDVTTEIYEISKRLFKELWDNKTPLRLLGVSLTDIVRGEYEQQSLFVDPKREKSRRIDKAIDSIRGKYGSDTVVRGAVLDSSVSVGQKYKAQIENKRKKK